MSKLGYIALYRKIQDNFLWEEKRVFSKAEAWIDILMEARWKEEPKEVVIKNKRLVCGYGQCLYSLETWARRWNWNKTKVKRVLGLFADCSMIVLESVTVSVRITVCNYGQYDPRRNANETDLKRTWNANETEVAPTKEGKKEKNVKKERTETHTSKLNGKCPHDEILELYHQVCPHLPKIRDWTPSRQSLLRARWNESKERQDVKWWHQFFVTVAESDFLSGRVKEFKADLEWLIRPKNFPKVIEGRYANSNNRSQNPNDDWEVRVTEKLKKSGKVIVP